MPPGRNPLVVLLLLTINLMNLAYILNHTWRNRSSNALPGKSYTYRGHDHPRYLPLPDGDLPEVLVTFEESEHYPVEGPTSDDQWFSLSSASGGYVRLGPTNRMFMVTMFHELHCLRILNLAFGKHSIATLAHIQHCLNYLRLSALCFSDLSLEPGDFEKREYEVERVGATHVCRDWSSIYPVMDENYAAWKNMTANKQPSIIA
ncbi:hypothetical protein OH77DRAFT_1416377 [Trametes cingulata]|nr:hypothetical protein OH77DRAFT_1416377 [Trametes cingulata]